jgi:hypothetical protein
MSKGVIAMDQQRTLTILGRTIGSVLATVFVLGRIALSMA